jgi:hypothetical protein
MSEHAATTQQSALKGRLLGTNEIYVADLLITEREQAKLLGWVEERHRLGRLLENPRDPGAFSTPFRSSTGSLTRLTGIEAQRGTACGEIHPVWVPVIDDRAEDAMPDEVWDIRSRIVDLLGLAGLEEDDYKGSFLSYIAPGAGIHRHRDARLMIRGAERLILRCNILLKRPRQGGLPVVEATEIDVPDRGMWAFFPTELFHSATTVGGTEYRGLLSFGFLVRPADLWERRFRLAPEFEQAYGLDAGLASRRALIGQFRGAAAAQGVGALQLDLLEYVLLSDGDVTVHDAARSLDRPPPQTLDALQSLQRAEVVESHSSLCPAGARVVVL